MVTNKFYNIIIIKGHNLIVKNTGYFMVTTFFYKSELVFDFGHF